MDPVRRVEFFDRGIEFSIINFPLVRTPMIEPTKFYEQVTALTPDDAADFIVDAIIRRPIRIATRLGILSARSCMRSYRAWAR